MARRPKPRRPEVGLVPNWLRRLLTPWIITLLSIVVAESLYAYFYITLLHTYETGWYGFVISFIIPLLVALPTSYFVIRLLNMADDARIRLEAETTLRSQLLGILSHDVRSPLAVLINLIDLLKEDLSQDEFNEIIEQLSPQLKLTKDTLDRITYWAKLRIHDAQPELLEVSIKEMEQDLIDYQKLLASSRNVKVSFQWDPSLKIITDKDIVIIVLTNLLSNAIKHSPAGGTVYIRTEVQDQSVQIHVEDEGPGIPSESLEDLLKVDPTNTTLGSGDSMGVGLFLAREFIEFVDGRLEARNRPEKGAQFSITLRS